MKLTWNSNAGWDVTLGKEPRHVAFDVDAFANSPLTLQPGATELYRQLARSPDYLSWWADACGGEAPGIRRFSIQTPPEHWDRPWESTISALDEKRWRDVSMVRIMYGQSAIIAPQEIGTPLTVLVVQGKEAMVGLRGLDLEAELAALTLARSNLDAAARARVCPIDARAISSTELVTTLIEVKPTILWLSGHAIEDPAGFLLSDGEWLTPEILAASIREAAKTSLSVPLYVVLWACKTGLKERFAAPRAAPPFINALAATGVSAVLGTLGPLADDIAADFAANVFETIASGRPLDHAVARARAALMAKQLTSGDRNDWACPVVWCVDVPADDIVWSEATAPVQRQNLARRLLPEDLLPSVLDERGSAQTAIWAAHRRIWVVNRSASAFQVRSEWLGRVFGQQAIGNQMVVVLDLRNGSTHNVLRDWANRLLRQADGFDDPDRQLRHLAKIIEQDPESGWRELCSHETVILALLGPPEGEDWFWQEIRRGRAAAIVLAESYPADAAANGWKAEKLTVAGRQPEFDPSRHPLAPALAVLAFPVAEGDLTAIDGGQVEVLKHAGFLLQTRAGFVMPLSSAASFVDQLDSDQLIAAHRCAFRMLDGGVARAKIQEGDNEALLKARLHHARSGKDPTALSTAAQQLMDLYRRERRASALLDVFDKADYREIDEGWKISAGWAHLMIGSPAMAKDWLEMADDDQLTAVCQANKRQLMAEVEKSSGALGSKERARAQLEEALALLRSEPGSIVQLTRLRIQHDLARLTHFLDGQPGSAALQYDAIYREWQTIPHSRIDQAITLRNLAEARIMMIDHGASDRTALLDLADGNLSVARDSLPPNTAHPVAAELEYVAGRLAVRRDDEEAATACFRQARMVGLATNHLMLAAIAEARLFWRDINQQAVERYDPGRWAERAAALTPFQGHAWTARVLIDGHLKSARNLLAGGLMRPAINALLAARSLIDANPAFDAGSDRARIVAVSAGLVVTRKDETMWEKLPALYEWADSWMTDRNACTPVQAWEASRNG